MRSRSRVVPVLAAVLLTAGCGKAPPVPTPEPMPAPDPAATPEITSTFTWTAEPKPESIPDESVRGSVGGAPFEVETIVFEPALRSGWKMILAEAALKRPTQLVAGCRFISIELPEDPAAGRTRQRPLRYGNGFIQLYAKDEPGRLVSWNSDNAWVLQLDRWEVEPDDPQSKQPAGLASGKVAVCFQAGYGYPDAWAAGTFKDAIVRYRPLPDEPAPG